MSTQFEAILDDCLQRLLQGEDIAACLERYPAYAPELAPLLRTAAMLRDLPQPRLNPHRRAAIGARLRAEARSRTHTRQTLPLIWRFARLAFALLLAVVLATGSVWAAEDSLPGSPLYPLKRATEQVQLWLAPDAESRAILHLRWADRRAAELLALIEAGTTVEPALVQAPVEQLSSAVEEAEHLAVLPGELNVILLNSILAHIQAEYERLAIVRGRASLDLRPQVDEALVTIARLRSRAWSLRDRAGGAPPTSPTVMATSPATTGWTPHHSPTPLPPTPAPTAPPDTATPQLTPQPTPPLPTGVPPATTGPGATPTHGPTTMPTSSPTVTGVPTEMPTSMHTPMHTPMMTRTPTAAPTTVPTTPPTHVPTSTPPATPPPATMTPMHTPMHTATMGHGGGTMMPTRDLYGSP